MLKRCVICKQEKDLTEFNKHKERKDGLQCHCKECNRVRSKAYYQRNLISHRKEIKRRKKIHFTKIHLFICDYLSTHPCVICKETNIVKLEFDHLRDKTSNLCDLINYDVSQKVLEEEIKKCQVLCANCHKEKTHKDINSYKYKYLLGQ